MVNSSLENQNLPGTTFSWVFQLCRVTCIVSGWILIARSKHCAVENSESGVMQFYYCNSAYTGYPRKKWVLEIFIRNLWSFSDGERCGILRSCENLAPEYIYYRYIYVHCIAHCTKHNVQCNRKYNVQCNRKYNAGIWVDFIQLQWRCARAQFNTSHLLSSSSLEFSNNYILLCVHTLDMQSLQCRNRSVSPKLSFFSPSFRNVWFLPLTAFLFMSGITFEGILSLW